MSFGKYSPLTAQWFSSHQPATSPARMSFTTRDVSPSSPMILLSTAQTNLSDTTVLNMSSISLPLQSPTMPQERCLPPSYGTSLNADLHFPLFCTPYYGFVPATEADLMVEILQLSSFLCTCCFSRTGEGLPNLGDSLPTASALLSMLSAIPNERPGGSLAVFPGTGVFIVLLNRVSPR